MRKQINIGSHCLRVIVCVLGLLGLHQISLYSYLLFHGLAEAFSIVIACGVFMLAWNARRFMDNDYLLLIGVAYLVVGGLDLLHTLAYEGMGVFQGYGANLSTQLWVATRYVESLSFAVALLCCRRKLRIGLVFAGYSVVTVAILGSVFYWRIFPICYIEGVGLTAFKKVSEYIISLVLLASIGLLYRKRAELDRNVLRLLVGATAVTIASELSFTFYTSVYGLSNLLGHVLKAISFYLVYRAIIETGLVQPYNLIFRDLTMREEALRKAEANHRALLDAIPDTMFRITQDGTLLDFKVGKGPILTEHPNVFLQRRVTDVFPSVFAQQILTYTDLTLKGGEPHSFEYQMVPLSGSSVCDYEVRFVMSDRDEVLAIVRDISSRKEAERIKAEFVSTVSHEIRTPLTSIRGSLGLVAGGAVGEIPDQADAMINIALKNSERLTNLINDILDTEKIESGKMDFDRSALDLVALVEQSIEANQAYGESFKVRFEFEYTVPNAKVQADANRLMQVLANLLSNAVKFTPANETVSVCVSRQDEMLRVAVTDRGPGIPEEFHDKVFDKFTQLDTSNSRRNGGTGLGLSICKTIIRAMGGRIGFETEVGFGTTFYFDLPEWNEPNPQ